VQNLGVECLLIKADVSRASSVEALFQQAVDRFGRLDAVAYLLSAEADFVSGHHLLVNGSADL
jgi:hypothetical protein